MLAETGFYLLILAMICAALQPVLAMIPARQDDKSLVIQKRLSECQLIFLTTAFLLLITVFVITDLTVLNVIQNSHTLKPLGYKIAAAWASHEGSMLLWCLILSIFGAVIAFSRTLDETLKYKALAVHGALCAGFLSFLVFTSNPFDRILVPPSDGQDLNPILQDPSLAIHPPMLFLGYVGFSAQFSMAIALLWQGKSPGRDWIKLSKQITLIAWMGLTAGLALGSYWAYYELGWGGWWFWDPVENAALMPWLTGTALLHTLRVVEIRQALIKWSLFLSILTFGLSVMGTFLVRSGLLTSVHSFAVDPERGLYILALAGIFIGGGFLLYGLRSLLPASSRK